LTHIDSCTILFGLTKSEKLFLAMRKAMRKVLSAEDRKRI